MIPEHLKTPLLACATLGLAPFVPMPHFFEKIGMLVSGQLTQPLDIFDLFFHGAPWAWLVVSLVRGAPETGPVQARDGG